MNEELLKRLDALAAKLGVTAQYLWATLLREAKVEGVMDLLLGLLLLGVVCAAVFAMIRLSDGDGGNTWPGSAICPFEGLEFPALAVAGTVVLIIGINLLYSSATELLNPEYFAVQAVLKALR